MTAFNCGQPNRGNGGDGDVRLATRAGREKRVMVRCRPADRLMTCREQTGSAMAIWISGWSRVGVEQKGGDARTSRNPRQIIRTAIAVPSTGTDQRSRDYQATLSPTD